jgi:hypothetical protein
LGTLDYYTNDGSSNAAGVGAAIKMLSAQTMQGGGVGTSLAFYTRTAIGSSAPEAMRINSLGNVGIGTTNPGAKLQVTASTGVEGLRIISSNYSPFIIRNSADTADFFRVNESGKVGIGNTNPGEKLSITATSSLDGIQLTNGTSFIRYMAGTVSAGAFNGIVSGGDNALIYSSGTKENGSLVIAPWSDSTSGIKITNLGWVGIGTTTPSAKLDVAGEIVSNITTQGVANLRMIGPGGDGNNYGSFFRNDGHGTYLLVTTNNVPLGTWDNNKFPFRLDNASGDIQFGNFSGIWKLDGSVGIGTTTPGIYKLAVNGAVGATSFEYTSDRSLKKNIETIKNPLTKIMNLRGVTFNWKKDNEASLGLIAQEVEMVFPELVSNNNGIRSVQYGNLVAPLIEAVKEQQKEIDNLNERIKTLETKKKGLTK